MKRITARRIGDTTAPCGAEPITVQLVDRPREPVEVVAGCLDFRMAPTEARDLAALLIQASDEAERDLAQDGTDAVVVSASASC